MRNSFFKRGFFQTLDQPFGRNRQTVRVRGGGRVIEGWIWFGGIFWRMCVGGDGKNEGEFFRKSALGSCLLWDNWVIFLLLFLWFSLLPAFWLLVTFWLAPFLLAFLPLQVYLLGNRLWCPSQCCCGAFPPRG